MRLIAVSRVLNEDDIIEAFVRHHAPLVDHHVMLDNGSTDRTIEILRALKQEGMRITVLQNRAPMFSEVRFNTMLFQLAASRFAANWVLFLDCDEFLDERRVAGGLRARLAETKQADACLHLPMAWYHVTQYDDAGELIVPLRIRRREPKLTDVCKVCVRGEYAVAGVEIDGGNHSVSWHDQRIPARMAHDLPLAHYYRRSAWQAVSKAVIGRLKVLAAGQVPIEGGANFHYAKTFETIRDNPAAVLLDQAFVEFVPSDDKVIDDPIAYAGTALRYTQPGDPRMKAISVVAAYAESLAQQHGRLIDGNPAVRMTVENLATQWTQIL